MVTKELEKIKTIQSDDANEFDRLYNEATEALSDYDCEIKVQSFTGTHVAYITYRKTMREFDRVSDEFHAEGIHYLCGRCPVHDPVEDGRQKRVYCPFADCGVTDLRHEACEMFYKKIKQNEIKPLY